MAKILPLIGSDEEGGSYLAKLSPYEAELMGRVEKDVDGMLLRAIERVAGFPILPTMDGEDIMAVLESIGIQLRHVTVVGREEFSGFWFSKLDTVKKVWRPFLILRDPKVDNDGRVVMEKMEITRG